MNAKRRQRQIIGYGDRIIRPRRIARLRYWSSRWRSGLLKAAERALFRGEINATAPFEWWSGLVPVQGHLMECKEFVSNEISILEVPVERINDTSHQPRLGKRTMEIIDVFRPRRTTYEVANVLVDPWSGACWTQGGWVLGESTGMAFGGGVPFEVRESWRRVSSRTFEEPLAVLPSNRNYFHWLIDLLPAFLASLRHCAGMVRIVGSAEAPEWVRRHCHSLGLDVNWIEDRVVFANRYYVTGRGRSDGRKIEVELLRDAAERQFAGVLSGETKGGIFISRATHTRSGPVEEMIERVCMEAGARVIDPAELDLGKQIRAFAEADWIVAPTGAALANLVWAKSGTSVLVVVDKNFSGSAWGHFGPLAKSRGLRLSGIEYSGCPTQRAAQSAKNWIESQRQAVP